MGEMNIGQLRACWRQTVASDPPAAFSKELLARAICYRLQEQTFGGLKASTTACSALSQNRASNRRGKSRLAPSLSVSIRASFTRCWSSRAVSAGRPRLMTASR